MHFQFQTSFTFSVSRNQRTVNGLHYCIYVRVHADLLLVSFSLSLECK